MPEEQHTMNPKSNPYNHSIIFQSWNVIYPVLIYFVVINLAMSLFAMLASFLGADYQKLYMALQAAATAAALPFLFRFYQRDKKGTATFWARMGTELSRKTPAQKFGNGLLMFLSGAAAGMALNNVIALTTLEEISKGYQEAAGHFFAGGMFFELLGACLLTPLAEELLYRGIVYGRLHSLLSLNHKPSERPADSGQKQETRTVSGSKQGTRTASGSKQETRAISGGKQGTRIRITAIAMSSLLFGAMHMNLVQFLYASILGLLLAWSVEESAHFYGAALAHTGANLTAVLRMETPLFQWMEQNKTMSIASTAALTLLAFLSLAALHLQNRETAASHEP